MRLELTGYSGLSHWVTLTPAAVRAQTAPAAPGYTMPFTATWDMRAAHGASRFEHLVRPRMLALTGTPAVNMVNGVVLIIVVLALISRNPIWIRTNMPASLGKPFYPGA